MEDLSGRQYQNYAFEAEIGQGGMAYVYRARDTQLDRLCAIKVLRPEFAADEHYIQRFLREARAVARLDHPRIVPIYQVGQLDQQYFIAMRYLDGPTLTELLQRGTLTRDQQLEYLEQIAEALDYAHRHNIVHRDVKPGNMIIDRSRGLVLTDFGIAAQLDDPGATATGLLIGTPAYMAPEQILGQPVTPQTDIYQLGATAYQILSGTQPFADRTTGELMAAHLRDMPDPVHEVAGDLTPAVSEVVARAMAKNPAERQDSAGAFVRDLAAAIAGQPSTADFHAPTVPVAPPLEDTVPQANQASSSGKPPAGETAAGAGDQRRNLWLVIAGVVFVGLVIICSAIIAGNYLLADDNGNGTAAAGTATSSSTNAPVVVSTGTAAILPPTFGLNKIAFVNDGDIYLVNPDGSDQTRLTDSGGSEPVWSPDGNMIAFTSHQAGTSNISTIATGGGSPSQLTANQGVNIYPAWSPDGSKIAFTSDEDSNYDIWVMNADGSDQVPLTTGSASNQRPDWSPDGSRIVFESDRDGIVEIYVMQADGGGQTRLTTSSADNQLPVWSPDGSKIVFVSNRDGNWEIYLMNADGSGQTRLTASVGDNQLPVWSPDGSKIAFYSNRDGNWEIYVMNADGTDQARLTSDPGDDWSPTWSPTSNKIAFRSTRTGNGDIWVMNIDGSEVMRLTSNEANDSSPAWSPIP